MTIKAPSAEEIRALRKQLRRYGEFAFMDIKDAELAEICRRVLLNYGIYDRRTHVAVPVQRQAKLRAVMKRLARSVKAQSSAFCVLNRPDPVGFGQSAICQAFLSSGLTVTGCYKKRYILRHCFKWCFSNL